MEKALGFESSNEILLSIYLVNANKKRLEYAHLKIVKAPSSTLCQAYISSFYM